MMRSPSQCPGTARSAACAGRWERCSAGVTHGPTCGDRLDSVQPAPEMPLAAPLRAFGAINDEATPITLAGLKQAVAKRLSALLLMPLADRSSVLRPHRNPAG